MMDRRLVWLVALSACGLASCGWVDSSGRQENRTPGLVDLTQSVVENRASTNLGLLDEDKNLDSFLPELVAQGGDLNDVCIATGGVFANVASADFAENIDAACDPLVSQSCEITLEVELLTSQLFASDIPALRRPVAQQYALTLQDTDGASANQLLTLCISSESTAPIAGNDSFDVQRDELRQFDGMEFDSDCGPLVASGVLINDSDDFDYSEDDANLQECLVAELVTPPTNHQGVFQLEPDGGFSYDAGTTLQIGETDSFSYTVSDGLNESEPATVLINITGINLPPIALDPTATIDEDTELVLNAGDLATDPENGSLQLISVGVAQAPTMGQISFDAAPAEIRYTPDENLSGTDTFSYRMADAAGDDVNGTVSVVVDSVNDLPEVTPEQGTTLILPTDSSIASLLFTVTDIEDDANAVGLAVDAVSDNPAVATATVSADVDPATVGNWLVNFEAVADGLATITVSATDANAGSGDSIVSVTVGSGNQPPTVQSPATSLTTTDGSDLLINIVSDGLAEDPDGSDAGLIIASVDNELGGTVTFTPASQSLTFSPSGAGTASFELTVTDEEGASASATIIVEVTATQTPVLSTTALTATDGESQSWSISADSLATDADTATNLLEFSGSPTSAGRVVSVDGTNKILSFTPSGVGATTINVTVVDPQGNSISGALNVNVSAAAASPVLSTAPLSATEGELQTWSISADGLATDLDTAASLLEFASAPISADGSVSVDGTNKVLSFTPSAAGTATINVTITDPENNSVTGDLTVNVAAAPSFSPVLTSSTLNAIDGQEQSWDISADGLATDADTDSSLLVFSGTPTSAGGAITVDVSNKILSFTPSAVGATTINVTIEDPESNSVTGDLNVTVAANASPTATVSALTKGTATNALTISKAELGVDDTDSLPAAVGFENLSLNSAPSTPTTSILTSADLVVDSAGAISFTPDVAGDYEIGFEVHDEVNTPAFTFTVTVN